MGVSFVFVGNQHGRKWGMLRAYTEGVEQARRDDLVYLADILTELRDMASQQGEPLLLHLLDMACAEAALARDRNHIRK